MKLTENTRFSISLAMQLAILAMCWTAASEMAAARVKLDLLWKEAGHAAAPAPAPSDPLYVIKDTPCATSP